MFFPWNLKFILNVHQAKKTREIKQLNQFDLTSFLAWTHKMDFVICFFLVKLPKYFPHIVFIFTEAECYPHLNCNMEDVPNSKQCQIKVYGTWEANSFLLEWKFENGLSLVLPHHELSGKTLWEISHNNSRGSQMMLACTSLVSLVFANMPMALIRYVIFFKKEIDLSFDEKSSNIF